MTGYNNNPGSLDKVRQMYAENSVAKAAFDYFATCKNNKRTTTVDRLLQVLQGRGNHVSYTEVKNLLRELARLGCGEYVIGRRGHPSRLEWTVGLVSLGQVASGRRSQVEEFVDEGSDQQDADPDERAAVQLPADMKVSYPLRPDRNVEIILPKDLTGREAHRLAEFIKTLPFDDVGVAA